MTLPAAERGTRVHLSRLPMRGERLSAHANNDW